MIQWIRFLDFTTSRDKVLDNDESIAGGYSAPPGLFDAMATGIEMLSRLQPQPTADFCRNAGAVMVIMVGGDRRWQRKTHLSSVLKRAHNSPMW